MNITLTLKSKAFLLSNLLGFSLKFNLEESSPSWRSHLNDVDSILNASPPHLVV